MNIHIPGRTASTTTGTKSSTGSTSVQGTSLVTMPTKPPFASHFPKPEFGDVVVSKQVTRSQDKSLPQGQSLNDDLNVSMAEDGNMTNGQNDVPRPALQVLFVGKNMGSSTAQSRPEIMAGMSALSLQERPWDVAYKDYVSNGNKNDHTKENICPNSGKDPTDDVYSNADSLISCNAIARSDQRQSIILSPIPVTNKMSITGLDPRSEKQIRNDDPRQSNMPFVNYSGSPECSKHIFVTQTTSQGVKSPLRNESLDMSLLDNHSHQVEEILDYIKEQDKRIKALENEAEERNNRIDELVGTNSKLNARVMVLETAVALIQENLEP